ncbi:MAG TPA: universal stress protein [Thermodesulfovibrionales bacterium]|nr:universal stress protein [Thermodesulfovibrionales bacterium]
MKGCRKILIAVNGSKEVLRQGIKLAEDEQTWITVVKVIPENEGELNLTGIRNIGDVLDSCSEKERSEINAIASEERLLIRTRIEEGEPYQKIVEVAEEERCDVIVMGAKKRSWMRRLFGDNTVEKVINQAPCPVLVV